MSSKKPPVVPLILQQNQKKETHAKPRPYQFGSDTYERYTNRKNPFLNRIVTGKPTSLKLEPRKAQALFHYFREQGHYQIGFPAERLPHYKRKAANQKENRQTDVAFVDSENMKEDLNRLGPSIQTFFKYVIGRLQNDLNELSLIINELVPLFLEHHIQIKIYDAYRTFYSEEQFLATLRKISQEDDLENFEFFCSALFGYYSQFQ